MSGFDTKLESTDKEFSQVEFHNKAINKRNLNIQSAFDPKQNALDCIFCHSYVRKDTTDSSFQPVVSFVKAEFAVNHFLSFYQFIFYRNVTIYQYLKPIKEISLIVDVKLNKN